jgi:hypothetical protein
MTNSLFKTYPLSFFLILALGLGEYVLARYSRHKRPGFLIDILWITY